MMLQQVVRGDYPRIFKRLQLGKKCTIASSHVKLLHQALHNNSITGIEHSKAVALRENATALLDLYQRLKISPLPQDNPMVYEITEQIVTLAHNLNQSPEFVAVLNVSSELSPVKKASLEDAVAKLGHYYKASYELVLAARRRKHRIFQRIQVKSFQINVPNDVKVPSKPGSAIPLINDLLQSPATSGLLRRFQGSKPAASAVLLRRLNRSRRGIKVHAEIKLLFYYEIHPENVRPRVICANKSACYLCDLFMRVHGAFQTPRTFGKFNERWILPDWLDNIPPNRFQSLKNAVEQFSNTLDSEIGLALKSIKRLPDPLESAVGLSAQWSKSTIENNLCSPSILATSRAVSAPKNPLLDPDPSDSLETHQLSEVNQLRFITFSKYVIYV